MSLFEFPGGARFAFTIIDDTDVSTVENVRPVYDLLVELGMRTTKTVWPLGHDDPTSNFIASQTLEDPEYLDWVLGLRDAGFEITWHAATFESSKRERTLEGLARLQQLVGVSPRVHANHAVNLEGIYWGEERVDMRPIRWAYRVAKRLPPQTYQGHVEGSPYWWGDVCREHVVYARNLTFDSLDLATINPSMPYRDPNRPLVPFWFSASDAEDVAAFNRLLSPRNRRRLVQDGGFTIVATHFGKGFVRDGEVQREAARNLRGLAAGPGWFPTVSELLDWLRERGAGSELPRREWRRTLPAPACPQFS